MNGQSDTHTKGARVAEENEQPMEQESRRTLFAFRTPVRPKVVDVLWYLLDNFPDQVILIDETTLERAVIFTVIHREGGARHQIVVLDEFTDSFDNCALELAQRQIIQLMFRNKLQPAQITISKEDVLFAET